MGATATQKTHKLPQIQQKFHQLGGKSVQVGLFDGEIAWLGSIHEFGCTIPVTDKMRAWLHYHGIHLKKDTTTIVIPERSFLRAGFQSDSGKVKSEIQSAFNAWLSVACEDNVETILGGIGVQLASIIKTYAVNLKTPPKSDATKVLGARSSNPLVETGEMIDRITYHVE